MKYFLSGMVLLFIVCLAQAQTPATWITKSTNPHDAEPYVAYADKGHPLSDTAVFALSSKGLYGTGASIAEVDGKRIFFHGGFRVWARVLPGDHNFRIALTQGTRIGESRFPIHDMKPGHVYEAEFLVRVKDFEVKIHDLGENPNFAIQVKDDIHAVSFGSK